MIGLIGLIVFFGIMLAICIIGVVAMIMNGASIVDTLLIGFIGVICSISFVFLIYTNIEYKTNIKLQEQAIELGATLLSKEEVYNTSQADLDKLLKIGDKYFYITK